MFKTCTGSLVVDNPFAIVQVDVLILINNVICGYYFNM